MSNNHFIFDKNKCVGCEACVVACVNENGFQAHQQWRTITSSNQAKNPRLPLFYLSMACNHCEDAPCMNHCPALAFRRSEESGAVLHISNNCIGCKYCTWQCPYDAPKYNPLLGVIEKCTFCESRLLDGQKPSCASSCPTGALDFSTEEVDKSIVMPDLAVTNYPNPSIVIKELEKESGPRIDNSLFEGAAFEKPLKKEESKISALKEWPLLIFTFIVSLLAGFSVSGRNDELSLKGKIIFIGLGIIAAVLSTLHLGKKLRMWRSVLNVQRSWLSREILFFGIFLGLNVLQWFIPDTLKWIIHITAGLLCISIDMLYQPAQRNWQIKLHSGQSVLIAVSALMLLQNFIVAFSIIMIARLFLMIYRNHIHSNKFTKGNAGFLLRILSIFFTFFLLQLGYPVWLVYVSFIIGELIDRTMFYNELSAPDIGSLIKK